ncbi:MAG: hypothetical protein LBV49_00235 [Azonexus sp.]|jgi:hypothetical protein|nr:hypothetical protein [Azonexus sp.]
MNTLYGFLALGVGAMALIVAAVIWSLRRMPSDKELDELARRFPEAGEAALVADEKGEAPG